MRLDVEFKKHPLELGVCLLPAQLGKSDVAGRDRPPVGDEQPA